MSDLTPYIVVAWVVAMVGVFPFFSHPRRAVLFIVISGMLFLPEKVPNQVALGPLHFTKYHAISYAAMFGVMFFNPGRLFAIRVTAFDLPAIVWCLCPLPSVLTNAPPPDGSSMLYDALSQTWGQIISYGIPYLLGRMYFTDLQSFRELGLAIITGALVYVPFCLFEMRMSPQLHNMIYGYNQHSFNQTVRFGGYRPMVFMPHGLSLAMFMMSANVFAWLMWRSGEFLRSKSPLNNLLRYSPWVLGVTFLLLKSTGALALGLVGAVALTTARLTKSRWPLLLLVMVPIAYVAARSNGLWSGESLVQLVAENIEKDRATSLDFRLKNENMLLKKAFERPWLGWGGWGRNRLFDEASGQDLTTTDGLWIIALGDRGFVGLFALGSLLLLPVVRFAFLFSPPKSLQWASVTAGTFVLALWVIDCLPNAMPLPIYFIIAGGLTGLQPPPKPGPTWAASVLGQPT